MDGRLSIYLLVFSVLFTLHVSAAAAAVEVGVSSISSPPSFRAATSLNLTCNSSGPANTTYSWSAVCPEGKCFPLFNPNSRTVSTFDRPRVKALTAVDNGNYSCSATGEDEDATIVIQVSGVGVFNGVSLSTAKNNSYFTADDLGYLNIELHCIGAMGEGEWLAPNGSVIDFSNNVFNVEDLHGSAILVQKNVTVVEIDGSGVGSAVGSGSGLESSTIPLSLLPFNDSSLEGYYQCIAPDENQNDEAVRIGFFLNGRAPPIVKSLNSSENPALFGTAVNLSCDSVTGNPPANYSWYHNGSYLRETVGPILKINITNASNYGNYTCTASNIVGSDSSQTLTLEEGFLPEISGGENVSITAPQSYSVSCSASGYPLPSLSVSYPGGNYTSLPPGVGYQALVNVSDPSQSGVYNCTAENIFGSVSKTFAVFVSVIPNITEHPQNVTTIQPDEVSLNCSSAGVPVPDISWYKVVKGGRELISGDNQNYTIESSYDHGFNFSGLTILNTDPFDDAVYLCNASNVAGSDVASAKITVFVEPSIRSNQANYTVNEENPISFECSATGIPSPMITWYRNGTLISEYTDSRISIDESTPVQLNSSLLYLFNETLTINSTTDTDTDLYSCSADTDDVGTDSAEFELIVNYATRLSAGLENKTVNEHSSVMFSCTVKGRPLPSIRWWFSSDGSDYTELTASNDLQIKNSSEEVSATSMLIIDETPRKSHGYYKCNSSNILGSVESVGFLTVNFNTSILDSPDNQTVVSPNNATFLCNVEGRPLPAIRWFKGDTMLTGDLDYIIDEQETLVNGSLTIASVAPQDAGVYTCIASGLTNTSSSAELTVYVIPDVLAPPTNHTFIVNQSDPIAIVCNSTGIPPANLTWLRQGKDIGIALGNRSMLNELTTSNHSTADGVVYLTEQTLTINPSNSADTGNFSCTADNVAGNTTVHFNLFVQVPPVVDPVDGDRHIISLEESETVIQFNIRNAAPDVSPDEIQWIFSECFTDHPYDSPNIPINDSTSSRYAYSSDYRQLTISNVNQTDEGRYFLVASNPAGVHYNHIDIIVHGPPKLLDGPSNQTIIDSNSVEFVCEAIADPLHNITWVHKLDHLDHGTLLLSTRNNTESEKYSLDRNSSKISSYGTLTVHDVQYSDRGTYMCFIDNYISNISTSAVLTVHVSPVIRAVSPSLSKNISQPLTLYCLVTGFPETEFTWTKDGEPIEANIPGVTMETVLFNDYDNEGLPNLDSTNSSIAYVGLLKFSSLTRNDTAQYTCTVTNNLPETGTLNATSTQIDVTVLERPDPPINVTVTSCDKRTVDLSWQPDFDGNRDIQGYQVYRKDYDDMSDQFSLVSSTHLTTTETSFTVSSGIIPYTKYVFKVLACNVIGCTDISDATPSDPIRTPQDAPTSPPVKCSAQANNSTSMAVSWGRPDQPNGLMEYYQVSYFAKASVYSNECFRTGSGRVNTTDNSTSLSLSNLQKATYYSFSIIAYTVVGGGPPSDNTTCVYSTALDAPEAAPTGVKAVSPSSTSIRVSWSLPEACLWNGAITGYQISYGGDQVKLIGNESTSTTLTGLSKFTTYTISVSLGTEIGYGPANSIVQQTLNDTSTVPLSVQVTSRGEDFISLKWKRPAEPNGVITSYKIYYQPSSVRDLTFDSSESSKTVISSSDETEANITDLYGSTNYTISVTAINGAGESGRSIGITADTLPAPPPIPPAPSNGTVGTNPRQYRITLYKPSSINGIISHYHVVAVLLPSEELPAQDPDSLFPSIDNFTIYRSIIDNNFDSIAAYIVAEFSEEEFPKDSMYTIGNDSAPNDNYENGPLKYGSFFTFFLRAYPLTAATAEASRRARQVAGRQYSSFSSSGYSDVYGTPKRAEDNSAGVIAAVVSVIVVLLLAIVIVLVIVVVIVYFKRKSAVFEIEGSYTRKKDRGEIGSITSDFSLSPIPSFQNPAYHDNESDKDGLSNQFSGHPPIPVGEFGKIVDRLHANDNYMFSQEYEDICRTSPQPSVDVCLNPMNKCRNRYANIQAYDHSRVKLIPVEGHPHDYINANFLNGYNRENEYIATQGPLPDTVGDFWRMVWDHNVPTVVMLTNLVEKMRVKCSQYWPEGVGLTERYANISVSLTKCVTHADYCIRTFEIRADDTKEVRHVKQFHYLSWPDFGVPRHSTPLLQFLRVVRRNHKYTDARPIIVHCSAGVGRTGTLCTIDVEIQRSKHEGVINCYSSVRTMRNNRNHMVQTEAQYIFLHDALLEICTTGWTDIGVEQLADRMAELEEEDDSGETGYANEFNRLKSSQQYMSEYSSAMNDANKFKNRILNALPYDHNRVKLTKTVGEEGSDYINASFIDGFKAKNVFIATQGPLENTAEDFWRMVWEQKVSVIVMLCKTEERGQSVCHQYWPLHAGVTENNGSFHILCQQELVLDDYTQRELKLYSASNEEKQSRVIHHFQFTSWPKSGAPQFGGGMIDLLDQVTRFQQQTGNKPIVVHCSAGVGRTGTFCALSIAVERAKVEQVVNIFDTVKHLRTQRAHMVQTLEQYIFCYRAVLEYVDSLSNYANFQTSI